MKPTNKLLVKELSKSFKKKPVVCDLNLSISSGEIVGLLGPNGAGKSTSFYMILGMLPPDKGSIFLNEREITNMPIHRRVNCGLRYLSQEPSIFRHLTVAQNLKVAREASSFATQSPLADIDSLMEEFGLRDLAHTPAYVLSGGQRRRLEISRCFIARPKFLFLDEPFAGMDPLAISDLQKLIRGLKGRGLGVLLTDHNVRDTMEICDRVYVFSKGRVQLSGSPQDIVQSKLAKQIYLGEDFTFNGSGS